MIERQSWSYPAIIAAMGQGRLPTFGEMRILVRRIRRDVNYLSDTRLSRRIVRNIAVAVVQNSGANRVGQ